MKNCFILTLCFCLSGGFLLAQDDYPFPSLSPKGELSQIVGNTLVQIEYERPSARKRRVFGELVPWNKVWRTGAGHCTKISFDKAVRVGGQDVEKGKYSLFTIPNPDQWVVILNKDTSLYGSYDYNPDKDAIRFIVIPQQSDRYYETLTIDIDLIPNNARLYLSWEHIQIVFEIETGTDKEIEELVRETLLSGKEKRSNIYAGAAEYYLYQNTNLSQAINLTDKALELDANNGWARSLKVSLYEKMKRYDLALKALEEAMEAVRRAEYEKEAYRDSEMKELKQRMVSIKQLVKQ